MDREAIHKHIEGHVDEHIRKIQDWVRQPSVSWDNNGCEGMAELAAETYKEFGCQEVEILKGRFHPGVWAVYDAGAPVTVHNYAMLDTRTVNPKEWTYDPWGADIMPMGNYPKVLVGRGAMGAKGPYMTWLNALSSIIAVEGTLPVNIMFLSETEEIMGSPTYRKFAEQKAKQLRQVDVSFVPLASQSPAGNVTMGLGLKGMTVVELTASGKAWGKGPVNTVHSMVASLVDCPPFRLAQALATLTEPDGSGCAVKGLKKVWDYRKPLTEEETELLNIIAKSAEGKDWRDVVPVGGAKNVSTIRGGMDGIDALINWLYGPTFNIAGMRSGFLGPESGTIPYIIPSTATATIDMRLVVEMSPEEIISALREHLDEHGFADIEIDVYAAFSHNVTPVSAPASQAILKTMKQYNLNHTVWPIQGGGGPWTVIPNKFNVPCVRGGVIGGGAGRSVDEYYVIEGDGKLAGMVEAEKYLVDLIYNLAETLTTQK